MVAPRGPTRRGILHWEDADMLRVIDSIGSDSLIRSETTHLVSVSDIILKFGALFNLLEELSGIT